MWSCFKDHFSTNIDPFIYLIETFNIQNLFFFNDRTMASKNNNKSKKN